MITGGAARPREEWRRCTKAIIVVEGVLQIGR